MEINDRLRMVIDSHKLTAGAFADRIGVQRSNVSHVLSGRNKPSFEFIEKLLKAFPRVSAEWLLTGKQGMSKIENLKENEVVTNVNSSDLFSSEVENSNVNAPIQDLKVEKGKKIAKTVVFYTDFTFDVYLPNEQ